MARHWEDAEKIKASIGSTGLAAHICWFLGVIFAVLGIIADVANTSLGLKASSWLLLAVFTLLVGITWFIGVSLGWILKAKESQGKKEK